MHIVASAAVFTIITNSGHTHGVVSVCSIGMAWFGPVPVVPSPKVQYQPTTFRLAVDVFSVKLNAQLSLIQLKEGARLQDCGSQVTVISLHIVCWQHEVPLYPKTVRHTL